MKDKNIPELQLPDYLSIFRILAAVALVIFAITGLRGWFSWLFLIAWITDALDGYIARKRNKTTKHGAQLDSIGDAILFMGGAIGIIIFETAFFEQHLWLLIFAAGLYLLQLGLAFWRYGKPSSFHTYSAKTAALVIGLFFVITGFFGPVESMFYITIILVVLDAVEEIILTFMFRNYQTDVKGIYWVLKKNEEAK